MSLIFLAIVLMVMSLLNQKFESYNKIKTDSTHTSSLPYTKASSLESTPYFESTTFSTESPTEITSKNMFYLKIMQ